MKRVISISMGIETYIQEAKNIIAKNIYMIIATASLDGKPWISPVFFAYDDEYNLYWVSDKNSRHSKLVRENEHVAIVIFDSSVPEGEGDAVYFESQVHELSEPGEVEKGMHIFSSRATQDEFKVWKASEVTGDGEWRIYKAIPQKVSKLKEGEYVNGQYVDRRVEVDLK